MKRKWVSKLIKFLEIHGVIVFITHFLFPIAVILVGGMIGGFIGSYFFK